jgi:hypothetical protein
MIPHGDAEAGGVGRLLERLEFIGSDRIATTSHFKKG